MSSRCTRNPISASTTICSNSQTKSPTDSLELSKSELTSNNFSLKLDCQPTIHSIEENPIHTSIDPLYTLNSSILDKCCISDLHRARLKFWLMFELTNCRFYRETYATASKYLDMFFAQGNDVEIASLQTLGISCFMLAAKVVESRMPPISFDAFNRKDILKFEQKICFSFKFKLSPVTYVSLAELLLHSWDLYSNQNQPQNNTKYFSSKKQCIINFISMMEILDCIDLNIKSLEFQTPSLVLCLFFLEHRLNSLKGSHPKTHQEMNKILNTRDGFRQTFNSFVCFLKSKYDVFSGSQLQLQILVFILPFLTLKTRSSKTMPNQIPCLRHYICLQTYNEEAYNHAKSTTSIAR